MSIICTVYKKGSKNDAANFRPTYLTPVVCKILEGILKANILQYFKTATLFSDAQYGFVPRHSYLTNLIIAK